MYIEWTPKKTYLKIIARPGNRSNLGIISPKDGQLAVRPKLWELITQNNLHGRFNWKEGPGRHAGVSNYSHTTNHQSVKHTIHFLEDLPGGVVSIPSDI